MLVDDIDVIVWREDELVDDPLLEGIVVIVFREDKPLEDGLGWLEKWDRLYAEAEELFNIIEEVITDDIFDPLLYQAVDEVGSEVLVLELGKLDKWIVCKEPCLLLDATLLADDVTCEEE